jgi:hypothetical protein
MIECGTCGAPLSHINAICDQCLPHGIYGDPRQVWEQKWPYPITEKMIDAAARAIVARHSDNWEDGITEKGREFWRGDARAALEAAFSTM